MATYASYKKVSGEQFDNGSLTDNQIENNTLNNFGVKWVYGIPCRCSPGCCCYWCVPNGVCNMTIELWGAGGNGSGACSCNRCHHFQAAAGGTYNVTSIKTRCNCKYTVCAGGVYRCLSRECVGCNGCTSYVNGYNLSGFCACGGFCGVANTSWSTGCFGTMQYCRQPGNNGGQFAMESPRPGWTTASGYCHCHPQEMHQGVAPVMGGFSSQGIRQCWIRCGCWSVPYGTGGQSAMNTFCGRCCGQGGTGGGGVVRITYI